MCAIAGIVSLRGEPIAQLERKLEVMNTILAHRGPDGSGTWMSPDSSVGLTHRRLSIIDTGESGKQPMIGEDGSVVVFNGTIYNYRELQQKYKGRWAFKSSSDTETILASHAVEGRNCLSSLRGMFSFALWNQDGLFCARDRFGIKPFYYAVVDDIFIFASEPKALLPFLPSLDMDTGALAEYVTFQYTIGEGTLFEGVRQLLPGHQLSVVNGNVQVKRYWDVNYEVDWQLDDVSAAERLKELFQDSISMHLRSDVPVGAYLSGGMDSSLVSILAATTLGTPMPTFNGRFQEPTGFDESQYASAAADFAENDLHIIDMSANDFAANLESLIYHLDYPVAGPGAFPQFMVSAHASKNVKVVLGGQGGDEIFGGYARYVIAYFEQCIKAAVEGTYKDGNFVVTAESIIPNLGLLREYKPLMKSFWREGVFEELDARYFRLIDRSIDISDEMDLSELDLDAVYQDFQAIFNNEANVRKTAYFDSMTHYDFKCALPALLHVEDRVSMAHGLEARVPFLDHPLVEFMATVPADIKFKDGETKRLLKTAFNGCLPQKVIERKDKMGFPVPMDFWSRGPLKEFVRDIFDDHRTRQRGLINSEAVLQSIEANPSFSRKLWGLISLEFWHRSFIDRASEYRKMIQ